VRRAGSGWVDKELAHSFKYDFTNAVDSFMPTNQYEIVLSSVMVGVPLNHEESGFLRPSTTPSIL
jgi:hypothetical protein